MRGVTCPVIGSLLLTGHWGHQKAPTLMTLAQPSDFPRAPFPNIINIQTWGLSFQHRIFGGHIQAMATYEHHSCFLYLQGCLQFLLGDQHDIWHLKFRKYIKRNKEKMYWGRYAWVWCVIVCVCTFLVVPLSSVASRLNLILLHSKKLEGGFIYHIMLLYYPHCVCARICK